MSRTDILVEIKEAEANAKVIVEKAEADKKTAIANARRDSVDSIQASEASVKASSEAQIAKEKSALGVKREELLEEGRNEADKLGVTAGKKMPKVKEFLNKEFERALDATS